MTDNRKIALEACQLWQERDDFWEEFEYLNDSDIHWQACSEEVHPLTVFFGRSAWALIYPTGWEFRRKPRTITVTMPVPKHAGFTCDDLVHLCFATADRDLALAAIRDAMGEKHE